MYVLFIILFGYFVISFIVSDDYVLGISEPLICMYF